MPAALEFVGGHLRAGRRVAVHSGEAPDVPLCIALAAVLALFSPGAQPDGGGACGWLPAWQRQQPQQQQMAALLQENNSPQPQPQPQHDGSIPYQLTWQLGKGDVRRALALVSGCCPEARPTARMLKQVSLALQVGGPPPPDRRPAPNGNLKHREAVLERLPP